MTASPTPVPTPVGDSVAPSATKVKLSGKTISLHVSERSVIKITIKHRGKTIRRTLIATKAKTIKASVGRLKKGTYKVTIVIRDFSGNAKTVTKTIKR